MAGAAIMVIVMTIFRTVLSEMIKAVHVNIACQKHEALAEIILLCQKHLLKYNAYPCQHSPVSIRLTNMHNYVECFVRMWVIAEPNKCYAHSNIDFAQSITLS